MNDAKPPEILIRVQGDAERFRPFLEAVAAMTPGCERVQLWDFDSTIMSDAPRADMGWGDGMLTLLIAAKHSDTGNRYSAQIPIHEVFIGSVSPGEFVLAMRGQITTLRV